MLTGGEVSSQQHQCTFYNVLSPPLYQDYIEKTDYQIY